MSAAGFPKISGSSRSIAAAAMCGERRPGPFMKIIEDLAALNRDQRAAFFASVLGWTLDAFDFFLMVFMIKRIAGDFHVEKEAVSYAVFLTLAFRPLGALVFGWLADHFGRRPILMIVVLLFSFFELASAFATSLTALLILRAFFG